MLKTVSPVDTSWLSTLRKAVIEISYRSDQPGKAVFARHDTANPLIPQIKVGNRGCILTSLWAFFPPRLERLSCGEIKERPGVPGRLFSYPVQGHP
jgi:hypothetical protein